MDKHCVSKCHLLTFYKSFCTPKILSIKHFAVFISGVNDVNSWTRSNTANWLNLNGVKVNRSLLRFAIVCQISRNGRQRRP